MAMKYWYRWLLGFLGILFVIFIAFTLYLKYGFLTYYDYGVDKTELSSSQKMFIQPKNDYTLYDFGTVLYTQNANESNAIDYTKFRVVLYHMRSPEVGHQHKGKYLSEITFFNLPIKDYGKVNFNTIQFIHKKMNGEILVPEISYDNRECNGQTGGSCIGLPSYSKVYSYKALPEKLREYVYLELTVNGVTHKIEQEFKIQKAKHRYYFHK